MQAGPSLVLGSVTMEPAAKRVCVAPGQSVQPPLQPSAAQPQPAGQQQQQQQSAQQIARFMQRPGGYGRGGALGGGVRGVVMRGAGQAGLQKARQQAGGGEEDDDFELRD